jgi:hypothetical protein
MMFEILRSGTYKTDMNAGDGTWLLWRKDVGVVVWTLDGQASVHLVFIKRLDEQEKPQ